MYGTAVLLFYCFLALIQTGLINTTFVLGLKENILHNCDPVKKLPETSSSIYAEVQKPNVAYAVVQKPNTVNADVQKPNKQKINKPKKGIFAIAHHPSY